MKARTLVAYAFIVLLVAGCGRFDKAKAATEVSIEHFHQQYSDGKLDDIWNEAHTRFRSTTNRQDFDEFMRAAQLKLGKVVFTSNLGTNLIADSGEITFS